MQYCFCCSGECISGALHWKELIELCKEVGFSGPYLVISRPLDVDPKLRKPLGTYRFKGDKYWISFSTILDLGGGGGGWGRMGGLGALKGIFGGGGMCHRGLQSLKHNWESTNFFSISRSRCTWRLRATKVHTLFKASGREERYPSQDTNYYLYNILVEHICIENF